MKQLRNNAFKKVMNHLKELPFIEWGEKYCEINESYRDSEDLNIEKYNLTFDWEIIEDERVIVGSIEIRNNIKDFFYETSDPQWVELHGQIKSLFNFEK